MSSNELLDGSVSVGLLTLKSVKKLKNVCNDHIKTTMPPLQRNERMAL